MDHDALPGFFLTDEHPFASMTDDEAKSFRTDTKFFLLRKLVHYNMKLTGRIAHSERAENEFVLAVSGGSSWYTNFPIKHISQQFLISFLLLWSTCLEYQNFASASEFWFPIHICKDSSSWEDNCQTPRWAKRSA